MTNRETCPSCSQLHRLTPEEMKPMVLTADGRSMRCESCELDWTMPGLDKRADGL